MRSLTRPATTKDGGTMHPSNTRARRPHGRRRLTAMVTGLALLATTGALTAAPAGAGVRTAATGVRAALPAAPQGPVTGSACTAIGTAVTCDLYAEAGAVAVPGGSTATVPVWSFTDTAGGPVTGVGPTLVVTAGDQVDLTLHNNLPLADGAGAVSLSLPQLDGFAEDAAGAAANGGTRLYSFAVPRPGTYLYQAGATPNGARQVAMGLVGALVVRPAAFPLRAYAGAATAFDDEAVLVLTEIDPGLAAAPLTYDLRKFAPRWRLINGKVHPATPHIATAGGNRVLLRYVNGGVSEHAMGLLGARQTEVGRSSRALTFPENVVSESVSPGDTLDSIVTVPGASSGTLFPLYETALKLDNSGATATGTGSTQVKFGGMLTMLDTGPASGLDELGPISTVSANPLRVGPSDPTVNFSATISDATTGGSDVTAAEWSLDSPAGPFTLYTPPAPATSITLSGTVSTAGLSTGAHTIYVRGTDSFGNVGDLGSTSFVYDDAAPTVSGLAVTPTPNNGPTSVTVSGTASDAATGGSLVASVEARLDDPLAAPVTMTLATASTTTAFSGPLPLPAALPEGQHTVYVRATDSLGNAGLDATVTFDIDRTGPASVTSTRPEATNGVQGSDGNATSVEVSAVITDSSDVTTAEGFFGAPGADGAGFVLSKYTNAGATRWIGSFPLSEFVGKPEGMYSVYAHGRDAAGNWGALHEGQIALDRSAPGVSGVVASPNPTGIATAAALTATATDTGPQTTPTVTYAEWYEGTDPGLGRATPMSITPVGSSFLLAGTVDVSTLTSGNHTLRVRALDAAGNWSPVATTTLFVTPPNAIFSDGFETATANPVPPWTSRTGAASVSSTTVDPLVGLRSLATAVSGAGTRYVTDTRPTGEASYHASFQFNPKDFRTSTALTPAAVTIFQGLNAANQVAFRLQYRKNTTSTPQVRLVVTRVGGTTATPWLNMAGATTTHTLRVDWASGTAAVSSLTIDGGSPVSIPAVNTSIRLVDTVRLGPSAGLTGTSLGTPYFDNFASTRFTLP